MSQVKVVYEEKLGGMVSFGGDTVRVLKSAVDGMDDTEKSAFESAVISAQDEYRARVDSAKSKGDKVSPSKIKAEVVEQMIKPLLKSDVKPARVIRPTTSKLDGSTIKPQQVKTSEEVKLPFSEEEMKAKYDTYNPEELEDSSQEEVKKKSELDEFSDLDDELGLDDVLGSDDEISTSSSSEDAEDAFAGMDESYDIDLDI